MNIFYQKKLAFYFYIRYNNTCVKDVCAFSSVGRAVDS